MNIILIGFMGSGKTTVGKRLAKRLHYCFLDTDQHIEKHAGCSIAALFETHGETYFRALERELALQLPQLQRHVIASGGGMPISGTNFEHLQAAGQVVFLDVDFAVLKKRLNADRKRPLAQPQTTPNATDLETRYAERKPIYSRAHQTIRCTELSVEQIIDQIVSKLPAAHHKK